MAKMNSVLWERNAVQASSAARAISGMLRRSGAMMCEKPDKWNWTRGLSVSRVGCSNTVAIHFSVGSNRAWRESKSEASERKAETAKAIEFLRSKGYAMDERGWVEVFAREETI